jgi:hypothetical protein
MTDEQMTDEGGMAAWVIAAIVIVAIVLMILFARGPEDQERSGAILALALIAA